MAMSKEIRLSFGWAGLELAGSLHVPQSAGPSPAVLMAQGSGATDRDSGGYFEPIRAAFLERGIATFAFDKPGCGESSGDWRNYGLKGRAEQIVAGLEVVRNHSTIDGEQVGIWGHSQGGWLVQLLVGQRIHVAFAIASSAPTITVREQILYDCEQTLRDCGYDEIEIQEALALTRDIHRAADDGARFETVVSTLVEPVRDRSWYVDYPAITDANDWQHLRLLIGEPFEPVVALGRAECPFLAVYGELDRLLPARRGAEETDRALTEAGNPDATVVVFPLGDHRLQDLETGEFVDGYLDLLGEWTSRRVALVTRRLWNESGR